MDELKKEDVKGFRNFLRMDYEIYQEILIRIEHRINPKKSMYRKPLTAGIKLAITLRHLASGDSYHSLMYGFRVTHNTISKVIRQVCDAIVPEFDEEVIPCPQTPKEWKNIANQFRAECKFIWAEVGGNGSAGDAQVFNNSQLKEAIDNSELGLPDPAPLPNDD